MRNARLDNDDNGGDHTRPGRSFRQLEEAPGQIVYQSRPNPQKTSRVITGKRLPLNAFAPTIQTLFYLRLVGFPGTANIDHSRAFNTH